jgi:hypothetical protein
MAWQKLMDETKAEEQLSKDEALKYYQSVKGNMES